MVEDSRLVLAKKMMGARLRRLREEAGIPVTQLAEDADIDRSYIHDIEAGRANPTLDVYAKLLSFCHVDFHEFLTGLQSTDVPLKHAEMQRMLSVILNSGVEDLIQGIRVNLEALSEKAMRLQKTRASPRPETREGRGGKESRGAGRSEERKRRNSAS